MADLDALGHAYAVGGGMRIAKGLPEFLRDLECIREWATVQQTLADRGLEGL
jgi:hypothetical protein